MLGLLLQDSVSVQEVGPIINVAKAISEYGVLIVIAAFMLVCMFVLFKHFFKMFEQMFQKMAASAYSPVETPMEQIRVLQSVVFDLAKYTLMSHLERIWYENNLPDKDNVKRKVHDVCQMMYEDRKSKFDNFKYHGYSLSDFCEKDWIERMEEIGLRHLYLKEGEFDVKQAFAAIDLAYNQIKIEFYNNIISKS